MLKLGILGCGAISGFYFNGAEKLFPNHMKVVACSDVFEDKAKQAAEKWGCKAISYEEMLQDEAIDMIVNLTVPKAHYETNMAAIAAGKHVYTEKPFALNREDAKKMIRAAEEKGVILCSAPDSFMGNPFQTAKKLLSEGIIGDIVGVNAVCPLRGNEMGGKRRVDFFYQKGAGPIWDMGAYYLNVLISLFGPIHSVTGVGRITWENRVYPVGEFKGEKIPVEVPTHTIGVFELKNGVLCNFTNSFDMYKTAAPYFEVYGEKGTMVLPFPNFYEGDVLVAIGKGEFEKVDQFSGYVDGFNRCAAIADIDNCLQNGSSPIIGTDMMYHVVDAMCAWEESIEQGKKILLSSSCKHLEGMWLREAIC